MTILKAPEKGAATPGASLLSDVPLPALVIHQAALDHNIAWMQAFASDRGAELAPHGKTSMAPALFQRQLAAGAWGMTLATAVQTRAAQAQGVRRVLMANQLVGAPNMALIAELLAADPDFDFHCLVDHPDQVTALGAFFGARGLALQVMIEYGVPGGRCGCRSEAEVRELARAIAGQPALRLTGIEGYEGVIHGAEAATDIRAFADSLVRLAEELRGQGAFALDRPIVTASGSAWYDLIAAAFDQLEVRERFLAVMRPGSYVVHDHGIYREAQRGVLARTGLNEGLQPALEVWAHVQSLPEPGFAILALGKRDIAHDAGLPLPLRRYRPGQAGAEAVDMSGCTVTAIMDQHAFMVVTPGTELAIGDIVALGTSHPCLTFDKWRQGCLVDDSLQVVETLATCF